MIRYGMRSIGAGCEGEDVKELQIRLSGFYGGVPHGVFDQATAQQVTIFQRDYMGKEQASGEADMETLSALQSFASDFPLSWRELACPCGVCGGFGRQLGHNEYRAGKPRNEAYHQYEYPGIHRSLLWAFRAIQFYHPELELGISSGYRCSVDNQKHGRTSTNHQGKAIDIRVSSRGSQSKEAVCNALRSDIIKQCNAQIGWQNANQKALEPADIAPTWVHFDVRCFGTEFLDDWNFCNSPSELDRI